MSFFVLLVGYLAFLWTTWAVLFWGSIVLFERDNPVNRFSAALGWSALQVAVGLGLEHAWLLGLVALIAWLVFLMRVLLFRYDLGLLHSIGAVIATLAGESPATRGAGEPSILK